MDYKTIINSIGCVIDNINLPSDKKESFSKSLQRIKERTKDPNIYLGIVGEFSSGKSTLINALIGADFFVTNAIQGTTTVITKLTYSDTINLQLKYKSGKKLSYNRNESCILKRYLSDDYDRLSGIKKFIMKLKGWFGLNGFDSHFHKVFDVITTSNEVSAELDEVIVYYPSPILQNGLVIVDTPGTDSLIPEHNLITQRAIKDVCDLALVVVPATTPLSMTLVDFLEANLRDNIQKCRFIVTKIELLRKEIERTHLMNGVTKRIEQLLNVEEPIVIAAPTLASLESRNLIEKVDFLDYLSIEIKKFLTNQFLSDIGNMTQEIHDNKEFTINDKIKSLIASLNIELTQELESQTSKLEEELELTKLMRAKPLSDFMLDFYNSNDVYTLSYIEARISNQVSSECDDFKKHVIRKINNANSKDEVQNTMNESSTIDYGNSCFNCCYNTFSDVLDEARESFESNFKNFRDQFVESYGIQAVDFSYSLNNDPSWKRKFDFSYDKSNLTTFPVFRFFKSLDSVKQQMREDVIPKIDKAFTKIDAYYLKKARKAYSKLSKQMEGVKSMFVSKYQKVIDQRIALSDKKENILQQNIKKLKANLNVINNIQI